MGLRTIFLKPVALHDASVWKMSSLKHRIEFVGYMRRRRAQNQTFEGTDLKFAKAAGALDMDLVEPRRRRRPRIALHRVDLVLHLDDLPLPIGCDDALPGAAVRAFDVGDRLAGGLRAFAAREGTEDDEKEEAER